MDVSWWPGCIWANQSNSGQFQTDIQSNQLPVVTAGLMSMMFSLTTEKGIVWRQHGLPVTSRSDCEPQFHNACPFSSGTYCWESLIQHFRTSLDKMSKKRAGTLVSDSLHIKQQWAGAWHMIGKVTKLSRIHHRTTWRYRIGSRKEHLSS